MSVYRFVVETVQTWQAAATCSAAQKHSIFTVHLLYKLYRLQLKCTYSNYTEAAAAAACSAAQQQSTFTVQILYKSTVCNWTVLTVITHKLLLHIQLHSSTAYLIYKYCTNCILCNWTILRVITHKLLRHIQLHNSTAHLLYELYSLQMNCTYSNYTEAAATCSAVQQHSIFIVQTAQCSTELYLQ